MAKKHARYSPSTLDNLSKCIRFKYVDTDQSAANEGTELHKAYETGNLSGLNEEQEQTVTKVIDYTRSLMATGDWVEIAEMKLTLEDLTYGTADRVLIHKTEPIAHVLDAKFGRLPADYDFQIQTYGAALVEKLRKEGRELGKIITHVVAPRQDLIDTQTYAPSELLSAIRKEITELYEKIDDPFNPPTPHDDLCGKCARAARCPAMGNVVASAAPRMGLPLPSSFAPDAMVSVRDRAIAQVLAGAFETWAKQIKKNNATFAREGGQVPGYKLINRSTGLRIPSELTPLAITALVEGAGMNPNTIMESCSLAIGRLTKNIAAEQNSSEAEIKATIRNILGDIAEEGTASFLQKTKRITDEEQLKLVQS